MGKLWDKGYSLEKLVEVFTVGEDHVLDKRLVAADSIASTAHAKMLSSLNILTESEFSALKTELLAIIREHDNGGFSITREDEDCHTAIENRLVEKLGETGKKIHTGRSRNDQVLAALRLYTKFYLFRIMEEVLSLADRFFFFAEEYEAVPMPGRTHLQTGMPSSVGLWAAAFGEELLDYYGLLETAFTLNDQCPLGSAAGYGVPLPLDRELTARLLGFDRVQHNVAYVQNSRGKIESTVLNALDMVLSALSKAAWDIILFSLPEFGYFILPKELCSGSSIMPQKKNPDVLELVRSKAAMVGGYAEQMRNIVRHLYSGYNRDFQDTKGPFLRGMDLGLLTVAAMELTMRRLEVNDSRLAEGFTPDIYATDRAIELVREGKSFRDAYRMVAENLGELESRKPVETLKTRTSTGTAGSLGIETMRGRVDEKRSKLQQSREKGEAAITGLMGERISIFQPPKFL